MSKRRFFVVTHDILGDVFWEVFRKGLFDAAERFQVEVEHLRPGRFSPSEMARLVRSAVAENPDGLLATVPDVAAVEAPLREALGKRIPLFAVNTSDPRPLNERIPYIAYIGPDDGLAGQVAARRLCAAGQPHAALCVDHYERAHYCHSVRWNGIRSVIGGAGIPCERLQVPGDEQELAGQVLRSYLHDHPEIDAVFSLGPPGAAIVADALGETRARRRVAHMTFDLSRAQLDGIRNGSILATIDCQQYLQGFLGVEFLWLFVEHAFAPAGDVLTGPVVVDRTTLDAVEAGFLSGIR